LTRLEQAWLFLSALLVVTRRASAQPTKVDPAERLQVELAGSESDVALIERPLVEALRRPGFAFEIDRVEHLEAGAVAKPAAVPGFARLFIDLANNHQVTLYLADDRRERIFVRSFALPRGFDEVAAEQVLFVAKGSIDAILSGENIGVERNAYHADVEVKPPAPAAAERPKPAIEEPSRAAQVFGGYVVTMLGPSTLGQGPELGVRVGQAHLVMGLGVHARLPFQVGNDELALRMAAAGARLSIAGWLSPSPVLRIALAAGIGADSVHVEPRQSASSGVRPVASFWATDAVGLVTAAVEYRIRGLSLAAVSGFEVGLTEVRYVLDPPPGSGSIFVPWRLRPLFGLEIGAPL
jgi:hypothetical protein